VREQAVHCGGVFRRREIQSPITIECSACERDQVIFWSGKHGYDAEVSPGEAQEMGECPDDLVAEDIEAPHEVIVRFEYPSDHLGDPKWKGREPELFSWDDDCCPRS
jgi:hypothetical protein